MPPDTITLFFDATPLALWEQDDIHKTGIGRMATQTLQALLRRDTVRIILVCPCGKEDLVLQYISKNSWASEAVLGFSPLTGEHATSGSGIIEVMKALIRKTLAPMPSKIQGMVKRLAGVRPFAAYVQSNDTLRHTVLSRMLPEDISVWFSCFHPIPDCVADIEGLQRHVVVHDIIPLRLSDKHPFSFSCRDLMLLHLSKADVIWANSEFTRQDFLDYFPSTPHEKVRVAQLGGGEHFQPAERAEIVAALAACGLPADSLYFVSLATLEPRKGLLHIIEAFNRLASDCEHVHLILIGQKGWNYRRILKKCSINNRIHMPGFLPDTAVAGLLSGCLGFVYMSEYEGFGLPVVEAMSCGAPVITARATSLIEVGGDAVLFVEPGNIDALTRSMNCLLGDSVLRDDLRVKGLSWSRLFSWDAFAATVTAQILNTR